MTRDFVGIDYQNDQQLIYGVEYYDSRPAESQPSPSAAVEIHLLERKLDAVAANLADVANNAETDDAEPETDNNFPDTPDKTELDVTRREAPW